MCIYTNCRMLHVKVSQSLNSGTFTVLVFHTVVLIHSCRAQSKVIGPSSPTVAMVGEDITLPCYLDPVMDAFDMPLVWERPDLDPRYVLVWRQGVELESKKHGSYKGRTSLFSDELKNGNISLKLSKVKLSDEGRYRCFVPELRTDSTVQLVVGAVSSPGIQKSKNSSSVVFQCESAGWYPEPEVFWLDGEGNLLSAGPTETVRGPDDLYTVSSRVTVEKRHNNSFTCRVQQKDINQTRETRIQVPDDFFPGWSDSSSSSSAPTIMGLVVGIMLILAVVFVVVWLWRQNKIRNKKHHEDEQKQKGREMNSNSIGNNAEQESLMERETDREQLAEEMETINNEEAKPVGENTEQLMEGQAVKNLQTEEEEQKIKSTGEKTQAQEETNGEQLMAERETLTEMDKEKEQLMRKEQEYFKRRCSWIEGKKKLKEKQIKELNVQLEEVERQTEETERKLRSLNREEDKKEEAEKDER
ncbi:butyrophilin subfamily 3 member A2-like isoform X2 [Micropterus dolomieu]|uniref:butyrophilin subfamily 3 member A2-like isoform X2 n=1 Tax=Micropterus dolomieu TaxID=147949 RepID=UPI001E8DFC70|nr:butyrophilin subfamily 3 member A2-like isoform X2 [Micropterus dolomieu]